MSTFDEYVAHVRDVVLAAEPEAEEGTSYGMLAWRLDGKPLLGVNEAKAHIGIYPSARPCRRGPRPARRFR